uniref:Uncharacterized protein n=1 Tax=Arundo donax TaxID=35708 RepID=A0A0A8ZDK1_ARUDO
MEVDQQFLFLPMGSSNFKCFWFFKEARNKHTE